MHCALKNIYKKFIVCFTSHLSLEYFNPIVHRKARSVCNFGLSECNRVNKIASMKGMMKIYSLQVFFP